MSLAMTSTTTTASRDWQKLATLAAYVLAVGIVLALAGLHVIKPLTGDQAAFTVGAQTLEAGGRLYVDYWDFKQPGVFVFYWVAGHFFGFDAWGIHFGEVVYWVAISVAATLLLRPLLVDRRLAMFAPLLFLAVYFGASTGWHATQVEALVAGPTVLAILWVATGLRRRGSSDRYFVLAGAAAGLGLWLKLAFAPIFLMIFAVIWLDLLLVQRRREPGRYIMTAGSVLLGVALVVVPGLVWFAARGDLAELIDVSIGYPAEVIQAGIPGRAINFASRTLQGMVFALPPLLPFLLIAACTVPVAIKLRSPLVLLCLMALLGACISVGMQVFSFWEYHFQIFFMPVVLIGVLGLDRLFATSNDTPLALGGWLPAGLFAALLLMSGQMAQANWTAGSTFVKAVIGEEADRDAFEAQAYPDVAALQATAAQSGLIEAGASIYVFGNPALYHLLHAKQAVPVLGWFWEIAPPSLFVRTEAELKLAKPVRIYMTREYEGIMAEQAPGLMAWLRQSYDEVSGDDTGTWFKPRQL